MARFVGSTHTMLPRMADMRKIVGKNLKELRAVRGWTQEKLAELAGVSREHIAVIEGARTWVSHDMVVKLAKALEVKAPRLFYDPSVLSDETIVAAVLDRFGFDSSLPPRKSRRDSTG